MSYALERIGVEAVVTDDERVLRSADKVIFPGVGEASSAMSYLRERKLDEVLRSLTQPFLGICLGLQLMCAHSEEGDVDCLGIFPQNVKAFPPEMKVPQIGWNSLHKTRESRLLKGIDEGAFVYFVHSYYLKDDEAEVVTATVDYGVEIHAAVERENVFATQFHPEKSSKTGLKILKNFCEI